MFPFYGWVQLSQGYSHFEEAVYFLPLSKKWGGRDGGNIHLMPVWQLFSLLKLTNHFWKVKLNPIAKTASKKIISLIYSRKFLSPEVALYLSVSNYLYVHAWNTAVMSGLVLLVCFLELLDKLQKRICRTF